MQVTYQNSFWDFVWFKFYQLPRARISQITYGLFYLFLLCFVLYAASRPEISLGWKVFIAFSVLVGGTLAVLILYFSLIAANLLMNRSKNPTAKLSISEDGVAVETPLGYGMSKWVVFRNVKQTRDFILLYLSDRMALLVPKRAFASPTEATQFFEFARERQRRAKSQQDNAVAVSE